MAGERTLPGLGLTAFWDLLDNTWKPGMDANLRLLSALCQPAVLSIEATEPGSPTNGDIYLADGIWGLGNPDDIMIRDDDAWVVVTPQEGWSVYNRDTNAMLRFEGGSWVAQAAASTDMVQSEITASGNVANGDLAGNQVRRVDSASTVTITVPSSLTGTEPCTYIGVGAGTVSFAAGGGVTILSADGALNLRARYSSAALIPDADTADTYYLLGDLA